MDLGLRSGRGALQEVEVAALVRLRHVLGNLDHRNIAHVIRAIGIANDTWPLSSTKDIL